MPRLLIVCLLFLVVPTPGVSASSASLQAGGVDDVDQLPLDISDDSFRPLYEWVDPAFEDRLRTELERSSDLRGLLRRKKLAVGVVDLMDPSRPRFARLNGDSMMYAASLPKIAILLAAYQSFEDGTLAETEEMHRHLTAMIRSSSNSSATAAIDALGLERINEVLRRPDYELYDPERGGGLWVGKRYAKEGSRKPEPMLGISHAATVTQVCRFYYMVATGRVIGRERSRQMLGDLADPGLHHKFVGVIEKRAPRARLFRKSGTWRDWHSDSVMVWGPERRYILVALAESPRGETLLRGLAATVDDVVAGRGTSTRGARAEPLE